MKWKHFWFTIGLQFLVAILCIVFVPSGYVGTVMFAINGTVAVIFAWKFFPRKTR